MKATWYNIFIPLLSQDDDVPEELQNTAEYQELMALQQLRQEHLQSLDPSLAQHTDFKASQGHSSLMIWATLWYFGEKIENQARGEKQILGPFQAILWHMKDYFSNNCKKMDENSSSVF